MAKSIKSSAFYFSNKGRTVWFLSVLFAQIGAHSKSLHGHINVLSIPDKSFSAPTTLERVLNRFSLELQYIVLHGSDKRQNECS